MARGLRFWGGMACGALLAPSLVWAVEPGQVDDFEGSTTMGWEGANFGLTGFGPRVEITGGPGGALDGFLRLSSRGGFGDGSKLTMHNRSQWLGDYLDTGITFIEMDLKNFGSSPLSIRLGFKPTTSGGSGGYSSAVPFQLANDGQWHRAVFGISEQDLARVQPLSALVTYDSLLSDVREFRILHALNSSVQGDEVVANIGLDNITAVAAPPQWIRDGGGSWGDEQNWSGGVPAGVGAAANLLGGLASAGNAPAIITLDGNRTVGSVTFDNTVTNGADPFSYVIEANGDNSLTINGGGPPGAIAVQSGQHAIAARVSIVGSALMVLAGGTQLNVTQPISLSAGGSLSRSGAGLLQAASVSLESSATLFLSEGTTVTSSITGTGNLVAALGASLTADSIRVSSLNVQGTAAIEESGDGDIHSDSGTSTADTLSIGANGTLDIGNNHLVVRNGTVASIRQELIEGRGVAPGGTANAPWNGTTGITSSAATEAFMIASSETRSIGYALNSDRGLGALSMFGGVEVNPTDILIRHTRNGDVSLNGVVDDDDVTVVGGFYNPAHDPAVDGPRHWYQGDLNYDGIVNDTDVAMLGGFYNPGLVAVAPVAVPEAGVGVWIAFGAGIVARRRK